MKKNLGQLLVEKGLVSEKVLGEALQRQVIFGGRLGTNLLEMGALAEEDLIRVLADQCQTRYAEPVHFTNLPRQVLDSIPRDLVAKHRIVPLALDGNRVTLAMSDPRKLDIIDEVSFKTGKTITPVIATELRLVQALEKYYDIRREARYVYVPPNREGAVEKTILPAPQAPAPDGEEQHEAEILELTPEDFAPAEPLDMDPVNHAFLNIRNRDEVALTVIRAGLEVLDDVFMFIVKGSDATGWMSGGSAKPIVDFGSLTFPVAPPNALGRVRDSRTLEYFKGIDIFESDPWLKPLSLLVPKEVLICPLMLKSRMVSALVGFRFHDTVTGPEGEYLVRVMRKASVAFEILIMKSRIIML